MEENNEYMNDEEIISSGEKAANGARDGALADETEKAPDPMVGDENLRSECEERETAFFGDAAAASPSEQNVADDVRNENIALSGGATSVASISGDSPSSSEGGNAGDRYARERDAQTAKMAAEKLKIYFLSTVGIAVLALAVYFAALAFAFDADVAYFESGKLLPVLFRAIAGVGTVWALSSLVLIPAGALPTAPRMSGGKMTFACFYTAFVMLADGIYSLSKLADPTTLSRIKKIFSPSYSAYVQAAANEKTGYIIDAVAVISSLMAFVALVRKARGARSGNLDGIVGIFPILRLLCAAAKIYFNMEIEMNSPQKRLVLLALVACVLFLLYDLRFSLPRDRARPRAFAAFGLVAVIFASAAGVGGIVGYFAGVLANSDLFVCSFLCLTFCVYTLFRLWAYVFAACRAAASYGADT